MSATNARDLKFVKTSALFEKRDNWNLTRSGAIATVLESQPVSRDRASTPTQLLDNAPSHRLKKKETTPDAM